MLYKDYITEVPDFPKKGIQLKDIMPDGHPGKRTHQVVADNIINKIRDKIYE